MISLSRLFFVEIVCHATAKLVLLVPVCTCTRIFQNLNILAWFVLQTLSFFKNEQLSPISYRFIFTRSHLPWQKRKILKTLMFQSKNYQYLKLSTFLEVSKYWQPKLLLCSAYLHGHMNFLRTLYLVQDIIFLNWSFFEITVCLQICFFCHSRMVNLTFT